MGGSKSPLLNALAKEIWNWCIERDIWVSAVHIAGKLNTSADNKSRKFSDKHEWSLSKAYFLEIFSTFPEPNIDLFASGLITNWTLTAHGNQVQVAPMWVLFP